jgi:hypothetical protein
VPHASDERPGREISPGAAPDLLGPRLYLGLIVLITAEVLAGSSAGPKLFTGWTWCVTYWLYFVHFFLFANLAARTGRTSLRALYLWGVLYGLYEGPITKVIWAGFDASGKFALAGSGSSGQVLGHGLMEMSMALLWHPVQSFLLPLCLATLLMPELGQVFPELAGLLSGGRGARVARGYLVATLVLTLPAVLSLAYGHMTPVYVLTSWATSLGLLLLCHRRFADRMRQPGLGRAILLLSPRGYWLTGGVFVLLYVLGYFGLNPGALPPARVQLLTLGLYLLTLTAIWATPGRTPVPAEAPASELAAAWQLVRRALIAVVAGSIALGLLLLAPNVLHLVQGAFMANAVVWVLLGPILYLWAALPRRAGGVGGATPVPESGAGR